MEKWKVVATSGRGNGGICAVTRGGASTMPRPAALGIARVNSALLPFARSVSLGYMQSIAVALSARHGRDYPLSMRQNPLTHRPIILMRRG